MSDPSSGGESPQPPILRLREAVAPTPRRRPNRVALSLTLPVGGTRVLAGAPGSGKTAVLDMIGLARTPAAGGLDLFGQDVARIPRAERYRLRRRIGMIFQDLRLIDELSVHANVALAAVAAGREPDDYGRDVQELLAWVGLGRRAEAAAGTLTEEGRSRLAVARAVINRPELVIADDPAGPAGRTVLRLLAELNGGGAAVLVASSDEALIATAGPDATWLGGAPGLGDARLAPEVVR
jgi:cell division transport system ATP-binding protein